MQGDRVDPTVLSQRMDLMSTTSPSTLIYASLDGWRRQMVEHGQELITAAMQRADRLRDAIEVLPGLSVLGDEIVGPGLAHAVDPLKITIDVAGLDVLGYQAAEWLRAECHVDMAAADARRVQAQITTADDDESERVLVAALERLVRGAETIDRPDGVDLPHPGALELETAMRPRDAFFAPVEQVPVDKAAGRIAAEMITPYPPGVPAIAPGEVITQEVLDYLASGAKAGMLIPDAADPAMSSIRVVAA
jgi:arginine/lysine/ornithine decarboxylase